ncbi:thioredoxin [Thorsellia anophelis]|uniref:Thioredoxin n=1 Tax=Thorsellia anophelis DSM 18579 TaxID=1123402 RepID=A0A1H9YYW2_9GAMM|nr:thioredoxin [Thorsellia anophelis]SES74452.1 thioredoxin [Thorsellia anophelis DSM 18579]
MAVLELNQNNFKETIENNNIVIIDFWAAWCGPCMNFAPIFEAASEEHPDVIFGKINTEQEREIAAAFNVRGIPLLMVFRDNIMLYSESGALPAAALNDLLTQVKNLDMDAVRAEVEKNKTIKE